MTLQVGLHRCKSAHSDAYSRDDGKPPFACISVEDDKGGRVDLYFDDVDSILSLVVAANAAAGELESEIDIAMEEADKAERRSIDPLPGMWDYSDFEGGQTDMEDGGVK